MLLLLLLLFMINVNIISKCITMSLNCIMYLRNKLKEGDVMIRTK